MGGGWNELHEKSANQHAIAIAVEAIAALHGVIVGMENSRCAGKCGDENEQAGFRQMKICEELIYDAEFVARVHEDCGVGAAFEK